MVDNLCIRTIGLVISVDTFGIVAFNEGKSETELEQLRKERQGDSKFVVFISDEEIYERYHNKLPAFYIDDQFADYVVLEREK